ncbi:porin [Vibrio renipiscarius]|uniref:Membrane protein n=1 Tax=Vibrio renipiscarius TaxID=1461322 RepID=A0A0C2JWG9_9VIBR|nr:porin [Vibrio renipiscarius]KII80460.1 membrane protein [Vibrio renipiscarius]KII82279.1 membrane protein [Vibrio renipiscarius]
MDKFFKRTLVCAAVASAAMAGSANAAIELHGKAVQLYGQAAGSYQIWTPEAEGKDTTASVEIESRLGLRGTVEFADFAPNFIYQIETGNADHAAASWSSEAGILGGRDTWLGLDFEGMGSIKFGRQLVAAYNYVDWPHTNPGLGNVFDWYNPTGAAIEARTDHVLRWDSANFDGFNYQASLSAMDKSVDGVAASIAASYTQEMFTVHAGYYASSSYNTTETTKDSWAINQTTGVNELTPGKTTTTENGDGSFAIVGGQLYLDAFTLSAAYKMVDNGVTGNSQDSVSASAQYVTGNWLFKTGYSKAFEADEDVEVVAGVFNKAEAQAITGRVMYMLPSTVIYFDVRNYDVNGDDDSGDGTRTMLGMEYYF